MMRYTRTQHRPASRQVNDHGRVSGTHRPLTGLPAAALILVAAAPALRAGNWPEAGAAIARIPEQVADTVHLGDGLFRRTVQAAAGTHPACPPSVQESPAAGLPTPHAKLWPSPNGNSFGVRVRHADCVAVSLALPQAPDLHYTWAGLLPTLTHSRTGWILSNHSESWPYRVTAVGPGGTTVITGELAVVAKTYN